MRFDESYDESYVARLKEEISNLKRDFELVAPVLSAVDTAVWCHEVNKRPGRKNSTNFKGAFQDLVVAYRALQLALRTNHDSGDESKGE